jgi:hypothetical protein
MIGLTTRNIWLYSHQFPITSLWLYILFIEKNKVLENKAPSLPPWSVFPRFSEVKKKEVINSHGAPTNVLIWYRIVCDAVKISRESCKSILPLNTNKGVVECTAKQ